MQRLLRFLPYKNCGEKLEPRCRKRQSNKAEILPCLGAGCEVSTPYADSSRTTIAPPIFDARASSRRRAGARPGVGCRGADHGRKLLGIAVGHAFSGGAETVVSR